MNGTTTQSHARPLLAVNDLSIDYVNQDGAPAQAVRNVSFALRGRSARAGGRKRLRQVHVDAAHAPAAQRGPHRGRRGALSGARIRWRSTRAEMADVRWKNISMIFQGAMNALNPVRTHDQIAEALRLHATATFNDRGAIDRRVGELLDLVGIAANRKAQYPHQYSGGMRQRAMIAMALACSPQIVIADEPTTALDVMIQAQILQLLADLQRELGLAVIFVTHDLGIVAEMCDAVLVMYGGVTAEYADVDTIYNNPRHPYTQELLKAFPDLTKPGGRLTSIPGYPPRLDALPPGCRFAPRCPHAFARCMTAQPPIYELSPAHEASCFLLEEAAP
ncbi:MAG: ABC transporter ATP-binding protein [Caldilineaceae bacterium]